MGNNLGGVSLRNYVHFPYHIQLGRYAANAIHATEEEFKWGTYGRVVTVKYTVDGSACFLHLFIYPSLDKLSFQLQDDICSGNGIHFAMEKDRDNLIVLREYVGRSGDMKVVKDTETYNPWGGVTKTQVILYGSGSKGGLFVTEQKIKEGDVKPYEVIVAHYYAASSGDIFSQDKIDIGLSMVLNIQRSSKEFDVTVEGPVQHPSSALFYMFEQVCKTGIWKPMACPHCANLRQSNGGKFWQSESEDSDRHETSVLVNKGAVKGNNNGNLFVGKLFWKNIFEHPYAIRHPERDRDRRKISDRCDR